IPNPADQLTGVALYVVGPPRRHASWGATAYAGPNPKLFTPEVRAQRSPIAARIVRDGFSAWRIGLTASSDAGPLALASCSGGITGPRAYTLAGGRWRWVAPARAG